MFPYGQQFYSKGQMITATKLLQTSHKTIQPKPAIVKPKHKTYRELLGLDRPKKVLVVQSDNENDDFLQKLLKEEEKKKKKKKLDHKKEQAIKRKVELPVNNVSNNNIDKKNMPAFNTKLEENEPTANVNKVQAMGKNNQRTFKDETNEFDVMKIWERVDSARKKRSSSISSATKREKLSKNMKNKEILIDETDAVPFIVNNDLHRHPHLHVRSEKGFKMLRQALSQKKNVEIVEPVLDPESKQILHKLKQADCVSPFRAKVLTASQLLSLTDMSKLKRIESRVVRRDKLFKNQEEESRFLKSVQGLKGSGKLSMPSLAIFA